MNFKRKLLILLISFSIIIPLNTFAYTNFLIPGGENIGIKVKADGAFVVGFYPVDGKMIAKDAGLKLGDRIVSVNEEKISDVSELVKKINSTDENITVKLGYIRDNKLRNTTLTLHKDDKETYKTGIYVKDTITGIGTITYINPLDNSFGALGHEIIVGETGVNFTLGSGSLFASKITSITKAMAGKPGEKNAKLSFKEVYGTIKTNKETGIFGNLTKNIGENEVMEVGNLNEVEIGKAEIITVLDGEKKEKYEIEILSIDKANPTKNFLIKVTDKRLLDKTGGIVKGMSGSPIIQNKKIIGAITHTIVDNPTKGYGISIIKMLEENE